MSFIKLDGMQVVDWPGRSPSFDYRTAIVFTEIGLEREGFYACLKPTALLMFCTKHKKTKKAKPQVDNHATLF